MEVKTLNLNYKFVLAFMKKIKSKDMKNMLFKLKTLLKIVQKNTIKLK